ncbi:MAG: NUDIX domain-containing protein, partial [Acidobacteria bacterium]|nr:NUDIX domain-containing protein [Acidobacteriota bacterium]
FPGGILNSDEARERGLRRIVREELGIRIDVGPALAEVKHAYTHFRITLSAFTCKLTKGAPAGSEWRWADVGEIEALPFSSADRKIARAVTRPAGL